MPVATSSPAEAAPFLVPTVDLSPYLADPTSAASDKIVAEVRAACISTGFFQITGHGIPRSLQNEVFDAAAAFFALPFKEKKKLDAKTNIGHRGYDVLASQSYHADVMPDLKEGYYIGTPLPTTDPLVQARRFFMGPNVWPPASLLAPSVFQAPTEAYYTAMSDLTLKVLSLIAATLPHGPDVFSTLTANTPAAPLRLLHYPRAPPKTEKPQFGAGAHTDFGTITLLLQDENPGLEVLDMNTGDFVPVQPNSDAYVVNLGDMMTKLTKNMYKSNVHRVINRHPRERYSVVFFFEGNLDCPLSPLDGSGLGVGEDVLTVEGHMLKRMKDTYVGGKK